MPTVKITAFDNNHLPAPILMSAWLEEWSSNGGTWIEDGKNNGSLTINVTGLSAQQIESIVDPTIDEYNQTHTGNDIISCSVS